MVETCDATKNQLRVEPNGIITSGEYMSPVPAEVTVVIAYQSQPGKSDTARDELARLIATVVATEPDCRGIRLLQETADAHRILLIEQWTSEGAFTGDHMMTPHLQAFVQRAPGFLAGPPEVRFWREIAAAPPP